MCFTLKNVNNKLLKTKNELTFFQLDFFINTIKQICKNRDVVLTIGFLVQFP